MDKNEAENRNDHSASFWRELIYDCFYRSWEENSAVDITDYLHLLDNHFDVDLIAQKIAAGISATEYADKAVQFHKIRIKALTNIFVRLLLEISDDGKNITSHNIFRSKQLLKADSKCAGYES